jgi:hypothetical protein
MAVLSYGLKNSSCEVYGAYMKQCYRLIQYQTFVCLFGTHLDASANVHTLPGKVIIHGVQKSV